MTFCNAKSEIVVPVFDAEEQKIIGTIDVEGEIKNIFSEKDVEFPESCAKKIQSLWSTN